MIELNDLEVRTLLAAVVAERGEKYVYPNAVSGDFCVYVEADEPSCIVGCFLSAVGVSVERLARGDNNGGQDAQNLLEQLEAENILKVSCDAAMALEKAQSHQDNGETWGIAAEAAYKLLK